MMAHTTSNVARVGAHSVGVRSTRNIHEYALRCLQTPDPLRPQMEDVMGARYIIGDVFQVLATLEPNSVDLVLTSPPFLALRSYLPSGHPDKGKELGSEATPALFIDRLLDVVEACDRVLAPHGSLCIELGDTYAGSGGAGGDYNENGLREGQQAFSGSAHKRATLGVGDDYRPARSGRVRDAWPSEKSLCGIPEAFMLSLAYGRNILRPERQTERWRVRNYVAWCRPNPPVGALGDKFRPATSYLTVACKAKDRWFDLDAVREPHADHTTRYLNGKPHTPQVPQDHNGTRTNPGQSEYYSNGNPAGAPPLDWWEIPTEPFSGAHYATFPKRLCDRPILAMCPREVCTTCGEPRRRQIKITTTQDTARQRHPREYVAYGSISGVAHNDHKSTEHETIGWTDCDCPEEVGSSRLESDLGTGSLGGTPTSSGQSKYRRGIVLDPFAGSGTALEVAVKHGRDAIGVDLDERNAHLAQQRCGMFLSVESVSEREDVT